MSYKIIVISKFGGPEVLQLVREKQLPEPKTGEVRIKVLKTGNVLIDFLMLKLWDILPNKRSTSFYSIGGWRKKHPEWFSEDLQKLFELLSGGKINPVISEYFPLEQAEEVHQKIESAELKGKVIFDVA